MSEIGALQVIDGTRRAVAPRGRGGPPAGVSLALGNGRVACNFRIIRQRRRFVTCELLIANGTGEALSAVAYQDQPLQPGEIAPSGAMKVPALSSIAVTMDFARVGRGRQHLVAAVHAGKTRLEVEAEPLRGGERRWWPSALALAAACVLALGITTRVQTRPHVGTIVTPPTVTAGRPFDVAYSFVEARQGRYELTAAASGRVVASGSLPVTGGVFPLRVPPAKTPSGYDLALFAENAFGSEVRAAHLVALATPTAVRTAPPAPKPAPSARLEVGNLAVERAAVAGGQPIDISYATKATAGSVRLIDQVGTVRAEALLNARGHSILIAPFVHDAQDFRIVVTAQQGNARAESSAGVRVLDAPPLGSAPAGQGWLDAGPVSIASVVTPSAPIPLMILRHEHDLRVALVNDDGKEIDAVDIAPEDTRVSLWMPPQTAGRQFTVVVSFVHGTSAETRIVPLRVGAALPREAS